MHACPQALGATATALLMLRMVDPDNKTILLRSFCFKQIFHVMICGGGVFTSTSVIMLETVGPLGVRGTFIAIFGPFLTDFPAPCRPTRPPGCHILLGAQDGYRAC